MSPCSTPISFRLKPKSPLPNWLHSQFSNKDLDVYVRRFPEKALDCCDQLDEEMSIDVCLHGMAKEYMVFLENLSFFSLSKLMEAARCTNESMHKSSKFNTSSKPNKAPAARAMLKRGRYLWPLMMPKRSGPPAAKGQPSRNRNQKYIRFYHPSLMMQ